MDKKFVRGELVRLYPDSGDFMVMEEFVGVHANEARFLFAIQDADAALSLAKEYAEWKKEG